MTGFARLCSWLRFRFVGVPTFLWDFTDGTDTDYRFELHINIHYFKTENSCYNFFSISENKCKILCYYMWFRILHIYSLFHLLTLVQLFLQGLFIFWNSENICKILYNYMLFRILQVFSLFQKEIFRSSVNQSFQMVFRYQELKC